MHAEAMLFVDHGEAEIAKGDALLKQGMGADDDIDLPVGERGAGAGAFGALVASREQSRGAGRRARHIGAMRLEMLARQHLRRRHQGRLTAGLDDFRHRQQRDDRLAGADIALQQPQHARGAPRSARISASAAPARRSARRAGRRGSRDARPSPVWLRPAMRRRCARVSAERQLMRQQFVEGQAQPRRRRGAMASGSGG